MEDQPSTSREGQGDKQLLGQLEAGMWTKKLMSIPAFTYEKLQQHLVLSDKTLDSKPAEAIRHKKSGYRLFKVGFVTEVEVKPDVKKGDENKCFLVRCLVSAEMWKKQYKVYVHLTQPHGDIDFVRCVCPAGKTGLCKHVAALLFQLLDYIELGLNEVPDSLTCTQELQQWHVPNKMQTRETPTLFEDLLFPQDSYEKDKSGSRKRPAREGKRESYNSSSSKLSRDVLMQLKSGLEGAGTNCPLVDLLVDADCEPCYFNVNSLPSRQVMLNAKAESDILTSVKVRNEVMEKLTSDTDFTILQSDEKFHNFVKDKLQRNHNQ